MSITDELREYAEDWDWLDTGAERAQDRIEAIADRIDAEHERECKEQYACGAEHGIGASIDASMIQTHGYVELPKDAHGVPFHIGELVDEMLPFGGYAAPAPIDTMELSRGASGYVWMVKLDAENRALISPKLLRHHAPTVEDVLREFALKVAGEECMTIRTGIVEEFAERLQLAGDAS